jgi:IgGFc binding protein
VASTVATFLALAVVVALGGASCSAGPGLADGGLDGGRPVCLGATACDGTSLRACRSGRPAEVIQECGASSLSCSLGRCTSADCAHAETNLTSSVGCAFYTFDLDNVTSDDPIPTSVLVTNPGQRAVTASLEHRVQGAWASMATVVVAPLQSARLTLPDNHLEGGGLAMQSAFRVTTDEPVTVAHVQSDDSVAGGSTSTGGTMLLPAHVLGQRYRALTYPQVATAAVSESVTQGARNGAGQIVIVGTQAHTTVTVTASALASLGPEGGAPAAAPGESVTLTLDDGDYYQLYSIHDGDDLTGTQIAADKPVAVFSGNISTTYGLEAAGYHTPDLAHEQLLPATTWGLSYVAAELTPQAGVCDPLFDPAGSSLWTILADRDGTKVHFEPLASGAPAPPDRTLNAGESFHVFVVGSFTVSAKRPILVMQGMDCEPTLSSAVSTSPWLTNYRFAVLPAFDTLIALARPAGAPAYLDGARVPESAFQAVGGGFEVATIPMEPCPPENVVCTHHVEGTFGLTMRGMDVRCSYALTVPSWNLCADPDDPGCS